MQSDVLYKQLFQKNKFYFSMQRTRKAPQI